MTEMCAVVKSCSVLLRDIMHPISGGFNNINCASCIVFTLMKCNRFIEFNISWLGQAKMEKDICRVCDSNGERGECHHFYIDGHLICIVIGSWLVHGKDGWQLIYDLLIHSWPIPFVPCLWEICGWPGQRQYHSGQWIYQSKRQMSSRWFRNR